MVPFVNAVFGFLGRAAMGAARAAGPWGGLAAFCAAITVIALVVLKSTSRQEVLARARNRAVARILEFRLYQHDLAAAFGIFGRVVGATVRYLGCYVVPLLVLAPVIALVLVQMAGWFEWRPFRPGEAGLLTITLDSRSPVVAAPLVVQSSDNLALEPDALRLPSSNQAVWRFRAQEEGPGWIEIRDGGSVMRRIVNVTSRAARVEPSSPSVAAWSRLAHPGERPLDPGSSITAVEISFPRGELTIGGRPVSWVWSCLGLTLVLGIALSPVFRVEL